MTGVLLDSVSKIYPGGHLAVAGLRLQIHDGEFFVLLGPSGCGKSTILRMIAGLEEITSGDLWLGDQLANNLTPRERNVAMVFQNSALYPHFSVRDNLAFPLERAHDDRTEIRGKVVEMARALGIDPTLDRRPATLSGGQKQRVAIGRAIIREPALFLMDEPLSNLDATLRTELRLEIGSLARSIGATTVYVTHDQVEALTLADRIAILRDGVLEDVGTPAQVYGDPATAFTASFLGTPQINLLGATARAIPGQGVLLDCGAQSLLVPWTDPRVHALAGHHGSPVIVGIRSDAVTPADTPTTAPILSGRVRALEFHGHEWLAQVETGMTVVDADRIGRRVPVPVKARTRPLDALRRTVRHRSEPDEPAADGHVGSHRRSDVLIRLGSSRGWKVGDMVRLAVDLSQVLFFDHTGRRVDPVHR
jgi:multiple sugar transport system ATP-binding protein